MSITLEALDAEENVLFYKVIPNVSLKRNRVTNLSGAMFTRVVSTLRFQIESDWEEENTVSY